jgi:putative phosphoribosyl transferase
VIFADRREAGRLLAARLGHLHRDEHGSVVVLALPRGGVPVGDEIATALGAPLDVTLVRKLGVPYQPELGMGAIAEGGIRVLNRDVIASAGVTGAQLADTEARERAELQRRARRYRGDRPRVRVEGRTVVVVDDGLATGSTARAACRLARTDGASRVVLAVPVAPRGWEAGFRDEADELVAVATPRYFMAIGDFYDDFTQIPDQDVLDCLSHRHTRA